MELLLLLLYLIGIYLVHYLRLLLKQFQNRVHVPLVVLKKKLGLVLFHDHGTFLHKKFYFLFLVVRTLAVQVYLRVTLKLILHDVQTLGRHLIVPIICYENGPCLLHVVLEVLQRKLFAYTIFALV